MIVSTRPLDCAPLVAPVRTELTDADLRRIEPLQRVLLSPLDHDTVDDWRRAVNRTLLEVFEADAAMFQLDAEGVDLQFSEEFESADTRRYVEELMPRFASDRRLYARAQQLKAGNRSILWGQDLEWLYDSEYFNELIRRMYAFDPLWAAAPAGRGRYPAMIHTYHDRRSSRTFFGARDVALMALVQPALQAGARTILTAATSRASLERILDAPCGGALIFDLEGRLLHRSRSLAALTLSRPIEGMLIDAGGRMARRMAAMDRTDPLGTREMDHTLSTNGCEYRLNAVLLGEGVFTPRPAVLFTVDAGERPLPHLGTLQDRFGLTRRQGEVAVLLSDRKTNREIAETLCISEHTVRSHVEAVMGKLGVHDRREVGITLRDG